MKYSTLTSPQLFSLLTFHVALPTRAASLHKVADYPQRLDDAVGRRLQTVSDDVAAATAAIWNLIDEDQDLAPKFVRLGFHDCVGGCNGCVDMNNADNAGLNIPIDALAPVVDTYESDSGLSRADIWALAYITGSNYAHPDSDTFFTFNEYGRQNCAENNPTGGPSVELPSADLDTQAVLDFFVDAFGFDEQETCAILGAHTIGRVHQEHSGFIGNRGWSNNNDILDNDYYAQIVGAGDTEEDQFDAPNWNQEEIINGNGIPDRFLWERGGGGGGGNSGSGSGDGGGGDGNSGSGSGDGGGGGGNSGRSSGSGRSSDSRDADARVFRIFRNGLLRQDCDDSDDENTQNDNGNSGSSGSNDNSNDNGDIIMLNADIALVRTYGNDLQGDGEVNCEFRGNNACPAASTLSQMAIYRNDNDLWLADFKAASERMLVEGCNDCTTL